MKDDEQKIKELLPAYLGKQIDPDAMRRVEAHLQTCEDCRTELALLRAMSTETVPDPGEAFWTEMPDRIYRQVREEQSRQRDRKWFGLSGFLENLRIPRLAMASALVAVLAVISWFMFSPAMRYVPPVATAEDPATLFEDSLDAVEIASLDASEIDGLAGWIDTEIAVIGEETGNLTAIVSPDAGIYEELAELNSDEMERLSKMIDTGEPEA